MSEVQRPEAGNNGASDQQTSKSQIHYTETPLQKLQSRIRNFKRSGGDPNQYVASCPGPLHEHGDRHPSLMVYETSDGTLLINCKAGCSHVEILHSIGLEAKDLYPDTDTGHRRPPIHPARRWDYRALIQQLRFEAELVVEAANKVRRHRLTDDDEQRLEVAVNRICRIVEVSE